MADKQSFLVLNLGSQRIGAALFTKSKGGGLILKDYRHTSILGNPTADSKRLPQIKLAVAELVSEMKITKGLVRYAISGQAVFTRFLKLPQIEQKQIGDIVKFEAEQNVPFPIDEVVWDYQLVGETHGEVEAVIAAIKAEQLDDFNEAVEETGIKTRGIDIAHMTLYNAFRYNYSDITQSALLIDIGARGTNLIICEGNKMFTRNVPVGGSTVTSAIEKEFKIPFNDAEKIKIKDGFVALGGAYAPHPDPEIAAMSKVVRDSLTRLHMEVGRTVSFFTKQQEGSRPEIVFLAGGTAGLPYIREFFSEKLNLPVEFFNPLRNVSVDQRLDVEEVGAEAHTLGELVGLGLRNVSTCPMELDLVPASVARARLTRRITPYVILAAVTLLLFLVGLILDFRKAADEATMQAAAMQSQRTKLNNANKEINSEKNNLLKAQTEAQQLQDAVDHQKYWQDVIIALNGSLENDLLWITSLEPMSGDYSPTGEMMDPAAFSPRSVARRPDPRAETAKEVDSVRIKGLWRDHNNAMGSGVVNSYLNRLRESELFDLSDPDSKKYILDLETGTTGGELWAYPFELSIPLKKKLPLKPTP